MAAQRRLQHHVVEIELGGMKRRGQVEVAVGREHAQMRVLAHRRAEVADHVGQRQRPAAVARHAMLPVPVADDLVVHHRVGHVGLVLEHVGDIPVESRGVGRRDERVRRVEVRRGRDRVDVVPGVAAVVASDALALGQHQFLAEIAGLDAQVGALDVVHRQAGVGVKLLRDGIRFGFRQILALRQRARIVVIGELAHLAEEGRQIGRFVGQLVVVPGDRRVGRQVQLVLAVLSWHQQAVVENRRLQHHAVDGDAVLLQILGQCRRPRGAVAFAVEEFGRVPAVVDGDVTLDEIAERTHILVHAPEILVLAGADDTAVAGADRIDENQIRAIEDALVVGHQVIGRRRGRHAVADHHAQRAEGAHVQPDRRRAGPAVVEEGDRSRGHVLLAVAGVGDVKHARHRRALVVADQQGAGGGGVTDVLTVDGDAAVGHDRGFFGYLRRGGFLLCRGSTGGGIGGMQQGRRGGEQGGNRQGKQRVFHRDPPGHCKGQRRSGRRKQLERDRPRWFRV